MKLRMRAAAIAPLLISLVCCRKAAGPRTDRWIVFNGADSSIDSKKFSMMRFSEGPMSISDPRDRAWLMFACDASGQAITIAVSVPHAFAPLIPSSPGLPEGLAMAGIQYRVDSAPYSVGTWLASKRDPISADISPMPDGHTKSELLETMRRGSTFTVVYRPENRSERTLTFRLGPFDSLLTRAKQTCGGRLVVD